MTDLDFFFSHSALIGVSFSIIIASIFSMLKISDLKKFDYYVLAISSLVAVVTPHA